VPSNNKICTFLTLGDSYTIGEGVLLAETYPYQTVQLLRQKGHLFAAPEIIARTGWTTDELDSAIARTPLLPAYDVVSLLIGVNNQYRGRSPEEYAVQFLGLLEQAIRLTAGRPDRVFILSIPDWGVSPFAADRDKASIAGQIDVFNMVARDLAGQHGVAFIDITAHSRIQGQPFTADGLHPAAPQYQFWAQQLAENVARQLSTQ
jgi:lysophospholipase L1-like esterase